MGPECSESRCDDDDFQVRGDQIEKQSNVVPHSVAEDNGLGQVPRTVRVVGLEELHSDAHAER